jgi:adenosine deaminase
MSGISLTSEYQLAHDLHGFSIGELGDLTADAIAAGFGDWSERRTLIDDVVRPAYQAASG